MSAETLPGTGDLDAYVARTGSGFDELADWSAIRSEQDLVAAAVETLGLDGLLAARAEAERLVRSEGIRFGGEHGRNWVVDPLPIVIGAAEWAGLEAGLQQRARLLSLLAADIYGDQRLVTSGVVPAELVWGHGGFLHQVCGIKVPGDVWLPTGAADLGRAPGGQWVVIDDRTGVPTGAGYAMTNRRITSRVVGELASDPRIARLRNYFTAVRAGLQQIAPVDNRVPRGVLLWSGPDNQTAFEQGFLATLLGFPLVEAEDLLLRGGRVWLRSPQGRSQVDVILRRVDSEFCDPLEFLADSQLGLAGLLEATRLGNVTTVNPLGTGILENPGLLPLLPTLSRQLLGEDLRLASAQTWWCGDDRSRSHVLAKLATLVIKPIHRGLGTSSRFGWELSQAEREALAARIVAEPWAWCGQDPVAVSTAPVVTGTGLEPRRLVLRCFTAHVNATWEVMPGGLARVAAGHDFRISNEGGALSKDVWVLDPDDAAVEPWVRNWTDGVGASGGTPVAPRIADNLFWIGRYTERADGVVRLLRHCVDAAKDHGQRPDSLGGRALVIMLGVAEQVTDLDLSSSDLSRSMEQLRRAISDRSSAGSVAHAVERLRQAAHRVPDLMSGDLWQVINRLERGVADSMASRRDPRALLAELQESTLALAGIIAESLTRDATWAFIDAGVRLERAQRGLALVVGALGTERASILDALVHDALLEVSESGITFRRRTAAGDGPTRPASASLALLLSDPLNPRSVAFQVTRLAEDFRLLGDAEAEAATDTVAATLAAADIAALGDGPRSDLVAFSHGLHTDLRVLAADVARRRFTRPAPRRATLAGWAQEKS